MHSARKKLRLFRTHPKALMRPVVVLSGWGDPGAISFEVAHAIRRATGDTRVTQVSFLFNFTLPSCRDKVIECVQKRWPSSNPDETIEVDVVAHSMGGLVARFAALEHTLLGLKKTYAHTGRRLRIHTLHSIATPHLGANQAKLGSWIDSRAKDMEKQSSFLKALNHAPRSYNIVPYAIEGDWVVGIENTAPQDISLHRFKRRSVFHPAHAGAISDPRILFEVIKRLRSE